MYKVALAVTLQAICLSGFGQQDKKTAKAREDVVEANKDLKEAKLDSAADFRKFRHEAEINIKENERKIAELRARKNQENKTTKETYDKKVLTLEQKNNELKRRIAGSETTKPNTWTSFKSEFSHDMTELGQAFMDIGVDNKK